MLKHVVIAGVVAVALIVFNVVVGIENYRLHKSLQEEEAIPEEPKTYVNLIEEDHVVAVRAINGACTILRKIEQFRPTVHKPTKGSVDHIGYGFTAEEDIALKYIDFNEAERKLYDKVAVLYYKTIEENSTLTVNQYAALISFRYNIGETNWNKSDLRKYLIDGRIDRIADEFPKFVYETVKVDNRVTKRKSRGLVRRRNVEQSIWNGTTTPDAFIW